MVFVFTLLKLNQSPSLLNEQNDFSKLSDLGFWKTLFLLWLGFSGASVMCNVLHCYGAPVQNYKLVGQQR